MAKSEVFMNEVISYLDVDWMIKKELREELVDILQEDYQNNFESFLKDVVITEDFGTTRSFIEQLYYDELLMDF